MYGCCIENCTDFLAKKVTQILQKGVVTNTLTEYTSPVRTANHAPIHELYYNPDTGTILD